MKFPFNINKVEQLEFDPVVQENGFVWYNTTEKVFKSWRDNEIQIFLTDITLQDGLNEYIDESISQHSFKFAFEEVYTINIRHNKDTIFFNYNIFDSNLNSMINSSVSIIDENEIIVEFIDPVSAYIFIYFE